MELSLSCAGFTAGCQGACPQPAQSRPLTEDRVKSQMEKTGNTPFEFESLDIVMEGDLFLPMQQLNTLRREGMERLEQMMLDAHRRPEGAEKKEFM